MDQYGEDITNQKHPQSLTEDESSFTEIALDSPSPDSLERGERAHQAQKKSDRRLWNKVLILALFILLLVTGLGLGTFFLVKASRSKLSTSSTTETNP